MNSPTVPTSFRREPTDEEIRRRAYQLYEEGGREPGRELENWLQAAASLRAGVPPHQSGVRSDEPADGRAFGEFAALAATPPPAAASR